MNTRPACPLDDTLARFASGELEDDAAEEVTDHLSTCELCVTRLDRCNAKGPIVVGLRAESSGENAALSRAVSTVLGEETALPSAVNGYTLHEELGRGGMGRVFRATHPRLNRHVAVKLLRPGLVSGEIAARFAAERGILARMDHPNIARIFDGGVDAADRPYVVMEYVAGPSITVYAATNALPLRDRVALVAAVARAVHHAHQKGIIHRDLKPGNILVSEIEGRPVPKVIDFGVARGTAVDDTRHTAHGVVVGTLEYMSPEQADPATCEDIDTRSDVYALGVLLYELLTGRTPVTRDTAHRLPVLELLRRIREVDPPPPSRVAGGPVPSAMIPRDLDWVTAKALEKDPARRYGSAAAFADDLERLGADEPVLAAPPGRGYRVKKFVGRNRGAVLAGGLVAAAVVAGAGATAWQAFRATVAEADATDKLGRAVLAEADAKREAGNAKAAAAAAVAEQAKAEVAAKAVREATATAESARGDTNAFAEFVRTHVLEVPRVRGEGAGRGANVTIASVLVTAEPAIGPTFAGRPRAEAEARQAIGSSFKSVGKYAEAERNLRRAHELFAVEFGPDSKQALVARVRWANVLPNLDRAAEAIPILEAEILKVEAEHGEGSEIAIKLRDNTHQAYRTGGNIAAAVRLAERNRDLAERNLPPGAYMLAHVRCNLAALYAATGRSADAKKLAESALASLGDDVPEDDHCRLSADSVLANWYASSSTPNEGLLRLERLIPKMIRAYGEDSNQSVTARCTQGLTYAKIGDPDRGLLAVTAAFASAKRALPPYHPATQRATHSLGLVLILAKKQAELVKHLDIWAADLNAAPEPPSPTVVNAFADIARCAVFAHQGDRAEHFAKRYLAAGGKDPARRTDVQNILDAVQKMKKSNGSKKREVAPRPRPTCGAGQAT